MRWVALVAQGVPPSGTWDLVNCCWFLCWLWVYLPLVDWSWKTAVGCCGGSRCTSRSYLTLGELLLVVLLAPGIPPARRLELEKCGWLLWWLKVYLPLVLGTW